MSKILKIYGKNFEKFWRNYEKNVVGNLKKFLVSKIKWNFENCLKKFEGE